MHKIAILANDHVALFELACAVELFGLPRPEYEEWYQCEVVTFGSGMQDATCNVRLQVKPIKSLSSYSTLIIPNWPVASPNTSPSISASISPAIAAEIRGFVAAGNRVLTFCSGAFLLAELGLLDGKRATTHWRYAESFKSRFPQIQYVEDVLFVYDGQIGCSAGSASGIDLGLEIIREDFGHKVANQVARRMVLSAHRSGGQSQFVDSAVPHKPDQFARSLDWAIQNLKNPIDIDSLARNANMTRRTFDRKFKASLNLSPKTWLTQQRVNKAKELLEDKALNVEQVATMSGFETATTMRHHFKRNVGISPTQYRSQFGIGR